MNTTATPAPGRGFSTEELAEAARAKPQTLRAGYCKNGHWCGIRPAKLPNGRLLWPADAIARLTAGTATTQQVEDAPCSN